MSDPASLPDALPPATTFLVTKEYRRFAEFCDACRRYRYIGLCYGPPGVGKTLSARHYTQWDLVETRLHSVRYNEAPAREIGSCRSVFYTPEVGTTPKRIGAELTRTRNVLSRIVENALHTHEGSVPDEFPRDCTELILVDEADRLTVPGLEQMRDLYDRSQIGLILMGMPGLEKWLSRYAQLYSRVGFVHPFNPLSPEETRHLLQHKYAQMGLTLQEKDFTDEEVVAAIVRITGGNFRLLHRLFAQIERVLQINGLRTITQEVVEAARESLVIGVL